jgi:hypothetical protein
MIMNLKTNRENQRIWIPDYHKRRNNQHSNLLEELFAAGNYRLFFGRQGVSLFGTWTQLIARRYS